MPYLVIHPRDHDRICSVLGVPRGTNLTIAQLAEAFTEPGQHRHRRPVAGCLRCELAMPTTADS